MEAFLGSLAKKTRQNWDRSIKLFSEWYGKSVNEILEERKDDLTPREGENFIDRKNRADRFERELEKFHAWMLKPIHKIKGKPNRPFSINSARSYCTAVMQLFRYYSMGITLRTGSPISRTTISTGDFNLKPIHIRAMFHAAKDLRSKLLISLGNDLGWGISDVVEIRKDELPDLDLQPPIYWEKIRKKTKQVAKTCLSETTVKLLKEYLFAFPNEDNPYLFASNGSHIAVITVNRRLKDLAQDADIKVDNKSLHWHCFRKMILSTAKNLSIDPDIIKIMTGKAVKKDILTYMTDINIVDAFKKLQKVTSINGILIKPEAGEKIAKLEQAINQLEIENSTSKTRIDLLQKTTQKQQNKTSQIAEENQNLKKEVEDQKKDLKQQRESINYYSEQLDRILRLIDDPEKVWLHKEIKDGKYTGKTVAITAIPLTKKQLEELEKENQEE